MTLRPSLIFVGVTLFVSGWTVGTRTPPATAATAAGTGPFLREDALRTVAQRRSRSVVFLHTLGTTSARPPNLLRAPAPVVGLGSGVVLDRQGLILTNAHVLEHMDTIHVRTHEGDDIDATVVGRDPDTDLALIRVTEGDGLEPAPLGDSTTVQPGDWVIAMGNPLGLHHTVTVGIISAKPRGDGSGLEFLQTDAPINAGSSGGALFDLRGALIGITTLLVSETGGNVGLNFAIPVNTVKEVLPQLRSGTVVHGWAGVQTDLMTPRQARTNGVSAPNGALVLMDVAPDGPAVGAGLERGDLLLGTADGVLPRNLHAVIRARRPGDAIVLRVLRAGRERLVTLTLGTRPR